jgi:RHS repeat-associated protein
LTLGKQRYGCDADGRVTNVTDWAGHAWTFTRDAAGRLTALDYPAPSGVSGSWTHDANHKVSGWTYNNGSPIAGRTITRDAAGVKTKEQVTAGLFPNPQSPRRSANVFDTADRLTSATVALGMNTVAETYLYDGNGALTNRQSAAGDSQYEYDCAGRLTYSLQSAAYSLSLTYDALGNRLTTYSANTTRIWTTDHADPRKRPLMETDSNGVPVRYFIWGGGLLLAVVEADGTVRYAHSDEQGSVVALTDSNGVVTDQYCYGPYGTDWGHSGTNSIPFRWLGSHGVYNVGGSALYLTRYRAYDAGMGRFLSQDPIGLGGGPNLYAYCVGSPLAYIDPLGLGAEARYNDRLDTINGAKALLQNQYGPVMGFLAGYVADILNRSVTTAYNAEKTGISPENAFTLGQIQGISEASAASATAGLLGLAGGELLGSAAALLPVAGAVSGQILPRGEGVLVAITPNGAVVSSSNLMLSHPVFAQQAGLVTSTGGLVPGAFVGTAFNNAGTIAVLNSMSFYGNQAVASPGVQAIVSGVITAR